MTLYKSLKETLLKYPKFFDTQKHHQAFYDHLHKDCKAFEQGDEERLEIGIGDWTVGYRGEVLEAFEEVLGEWSCIKSVMQDFESFEEMRDHYLKKFLERMISLGGGLVLFDNGDLD